MPGLENAGFVCSPRDLASRKLDFPGERDKPVANEVGKPKAPTYWQVADRVATISKDA